MKKVLLVLFLGVASVCAMAQSVVGKVVDGEQVPLEFVNVVLLHVKDSAFVKGTTSDVDGKFELAVEPNANYILKVSSIGYVTAYKNCKAGNAGTIVLSADAVLLGETVVTAQKQTFKSERGAIVATIANSILSRETSTVDVLRKVPGMMMQDDKPVSFVGGEPLVYINGKKVLDYSVVKNLPVKDIKTIKLITNPGAEYDASTGAVLLITTKKNLEGLSVQLDGDVRKNHFWSHNETLNLNYTVKKLTLFTTLGYDDTRRKGIEEVHFVNNGKEDVYDNYIDVVSKKNSDKTVDYSLGFNFDINDKHHIGAEYSGWTERYGDSSSINDSTLLNSRLYDRVASMSDMKDKKYMHHINAFYEGDFTEKLNFSLYADYLNNHSKRNQRVDEHAELTGESIVVSDSKSDFDIYAIKGVFNYDLNRSQALNAGVEYSSTNGNSSLTYSDGNNNSDYKTTENKIAGFAEYSLDFDPFSVTAGLRYEYVKARQTDYLNAENNISRDYSNLFPTLTFSYSHKGANHSLSYRSAVRRPPFSWLSTASTYVNRYQRQVGNPALLPQVSHTVQYSLMYKFLFAQASYTYNKDFMGLTIRQDAEDGSVTLTSWQNYGHEQTLNLVLGMRYKWGFYEPSLTLGLQKHFLEVEYLGQKRTMDKPMGMIDLNNGLHLPGGVYANVEYMYTSSGDSQFMTLKPMHTVNVTLQKQFFKDKLAVTLKATDLLDKSRTRLYGGIGQVYITQMAYRDKRAVSLHLTWRFNKNKKSYDGENAAREEMRRL